MEWLHRAQRTIGALRASIGALVEGEGNQRQQRSFFQRAIGDLTAALTSSVAEVAAAQAELVTRLGQVVEYRDDETGAHVRRVGGFSARLASLAGLDASRCELISYASVLHDVGKVGIPDAVLLKPGCLSFEERGTVETHASLGYEVLKDSASEVLQAGATIALTHHEKYDGSGYPRGLAGSQIPIEGRIVAIADVYDALSSDRVYRPAFPPERVRQMMRADRGSHFDPELLDVFLAEVAASELRATMIPPRDEEPNANDHSP